MHMLVCKKKKNGATAAFKHENQKLRDNNGRKVDVGVLVVGLMEWRKCEVQKRGGGVFFYLAY